MYVTKMYLYFLSFEFIFNILSKILFIGYLHKLLLK